MGIYSDDTDSVLQLLSVKSLNNQLNALAMRSLKIRLIRESVVEKNFRNLN